MVFLKLFECVIKVYYLQYCATCYLMILFWRYKLVDVALSMRDEKVSILHYAGDVVIIYETTKLIMMCTLKQGIINGLWP